MSATALRSARPRPPRVGFFVCLHRALLTADASLCSSLLPQAVHDITPITPRAKPPPYFYLTKPGMWKAIEKLESTNEELKRRLRDAHVFPLKKGMTPYTRPPIKWRKQEEVALLLGVGT